MRFVSGEPASLCLPCFEVQRAVDIDLDTTCLDFRGGCNGATSETSEVAGVQGLGFRE